MKCWNCGHENPEGLNECEQCGMPLAKSDETTAVDSQELLKDILTPSPSEPQPLSSASQSQFAAVVFDEEDIGGDVDYTLPGGEEPDMTPLFESSEPEGAAGTSPSAESTGDQSFAAVVFDEEIPPAEEISYDLPSGESPDWSPIMGEEQPSSSSSASATELITPDLAELAAEYAASEEKTTTRPSVRQKQTPTSLLLLYSVLAQVSTWILFFIFGIATINILDPNLNLADTSTPLSSIVKVHPFFYLLVGIMYLIFGYQSRELQERAKERYPSYYTLVMLVLHLPFMFLISLLLFLILQPKDILAFYLFVPVYGSIAFLLLGGVFLFYFGANKLYEPIDELLTQRSMSRLGESAT